MRLTCLCGEILPCPHVGVPVVCACGISYSATIDPAETHRVLMRTIAELAELRRRIAALGKEPA